MADTGGIARRLGSLLVALLLAAGMVWLGFWQMEVSRQDAHQEALREAAARPVVTLDEVFAPHTPFPADGSGRVLTARGRYEDSRTSLVPGRLLGGVSGYWVVTPLVVESTGARIPVVRGYTRSDRARPAVGGGSLMVTGSLAPSESPTTERGGQAPLPPGQIRAVHLGSLLNAWGGEVYNGFLFATREQPQPSDVSDPGATQGDPAAMERVPPPSLPSGYSLRNLAYAIQWWVFAAFVLFMWGRMFTGARADAAAGDTPT